MAQSYAHRLAPETLDVCIGVRLREAGRPVQEEEIPDLCRIRYTSLPRERAESLDRLIERGLIIRSVVRKLHPRRPLIEWTEVTLYRWIGGGR